ncbi:MAG: AAA family ATPase [Clostridia bacterium]|nr:AAA family ATPase [Clostridia bacterium]
MANIVTVISGKGGAGKTTVCVNVACCLRKYGYKVLVSDCSFGIRNDLIPLGYTNDGLYDISDVIKGEISFKEALIHGNDFKPDFLMSSVQDCPDEFESGYENLISSVCDSYDYIIIDTPASSGRELDLCMKISDMVLAVTEEDFISVSNMAFCVNRIEKTNKEVYCIINKAILSISADSIGAEEIADEIGCPIIGIIRDDQYIKKSLTDGDPIVRYNTYAGRELENISKRICKRYVTPEEESIGERVFDKNRFILKNN